MKMKIGRGRGLKMKMDKMAAHKLGVEDIVGYLEAAPAHVVRPHRCRPCNTGLTTCDHHTTTAYSDHI